MRPHVYKHHTHCSVDSVRGGTRNNRPFTAKPPSVNPVNRTHSKDSHPKPVSDRALTPSRTRIWSPLAIVREQGQDYPFTGPSPGVNPSIYPSSLPLATGKMLEIGGSTEFRETKESRERLENVLGFMRNRSVTERRTCK
jgi:hypothetical protein